MAGITDMIARQQMQTLDATFKQLQGSAEDLAITFMDDIADAINTVIGSFEILGKVIGSVFEDLGADEDQLAWLGKLSTYLAPLGMLTVFTDMMKEIDKSFVEPMNAMEQWKKSIKNFTFVPEDSEDGLNMLQKLDATIVDYDDAMKNVAITKKALVDLEQEGYDEDDDDAKLAYQKEHLRLSSELINANDALIKSNAKVIASSGDILNNIINLSDEVANGVNAYNDLYDAESKIAQNNLEAKSLLEERLELEAEMMRVENLRGRNSKEYEAMENRRISITRREQKLAEDSPELLAAKTQAELDYAKA